MENRESKFKSKNIEPVLKLLGTLNLDKPEALIDKNRQLTISNITYDSRQVISDTAFFCIEGAHLDGNQFIDEAIAKGASCIFSAKPYKLLPIPYFQVSNVNKAMGLLADYLYDHPSQKLRLIGITGTNGKTTTTHLIEHILNFAGNKCGLKCGLIGTLGSRFSQKEKYQNTKFTTPQASDLHKILAEMVEAKCTHVAMEVSSHALAQERVSGCNFVVACLTNISQDHLDFHKTMDDYWHTKRSLFERINNSAQAKKLAIVNIDDPLQSEFLAVVGSSVRKLTYGFNQSADIYAKEVKFDFKGCQLKLVTPYGNADLKMKLNGRFNVYNAMAAIGICLEEGIELSTCVDALAEFHGVPGRFEIVSTESKSNPLVIVDYAHTPDGLENVLKTARNLVPPTGRLISVFGCGGDRDMSKRPQMAQIAEAQSDFVIITSDNPRTEDPHQIIADILAGIKRTKNIKVEPDRASAIKLALLEEANDQDVVVIAGKGHEDYQILADKTIHFDDREQAKLALVARTNLMKNKAE